MNNKVIKLIFGLMISGFLTLAMPMAHADAGLCQKAIDVAELATQGTEFLGRNAAKDEASLLSKLAAAELKLAEGKFADVVGKLTDYQNTVIGMADAAKPKVATVDAYGVDGIADGIGGLDGNAADAIAACNL